MPARYGDSHTRFSATTRSRAPSQRRPALGLDSCPRQPKSRARPLRDRICPRSRTLSCTRMRCRAQFPAISARRLPPPPLRPRTTASRERFPMGVQTACSFLSTRIASGTIPDGFALSSAINQFGVNDNALSGTIPPFTNANILQSTTPSSPTAGHHSRLARRQARPRQAC